MNTYSFVPQRLCEIIAAPLKRKVDRIACSERTTVDFHGYIGGDANPATRAASA